MRAGDVIDYAYSLQGDNPVFAGSFTGRINAQADYPMDRSSTRLPWPVGRSLYVQNHGTAVKYGAVRKYELTEFTWQFTNVPAGRIEPPVPVWYHPLPWVQLSEFQKWPDVNRLALNLFTKRGPAVTRSLAAKIAELKKLPRREDQGAGGAGALCRTKFVIWESKPARFRIQTGDAFKEILRGALAIASDKEFSSCHNPARPWPRSHWPPLSIRGPARPSLICTRP